MHEFSIVQSLLTLIEDYARENNAKSVTKVVVSIGVLSGVEPHLLEMAFNTFKEGTVAEKAELIMEIEKLKIKCMDCGKESEKEELNMLCPGCGSLNTQIISGQDMFLKSLELEVD
ncbi:hydrogenase maturation nickel metallochaperone HypA [Aquifex aeolicus]|uniref:Hydrogenase maturation factor HypA n=1 Tax=Aquifex aeolicus (strain VF5) TaxID=224324 RepID=HYPA_AQUAE|nr:hydrogenase maturation nickel metallochaperone HypA [Aquifex aeolicus]O67133.1 RecName: Full=Hydrogenase maturation factor HypA [Aquifex aeolicus VF5]AAC07096.1 hydrogenase accessory protein HypA [Aquifex aeolicus VF5]